MQAVLRVNDYRLAVHLGCTEGERRELQEILVSLRLEYPQPPPVCASDRLEDAHCYGAICESLALFVRGRSFHTIEHLATELHRLVTEGLPRDVVLGLSLQKKPPVEGLRGVAFELGRV